MTHLTEGVSPMCRRDDHQACVWYKLDTSGGRLRRVWECKCDCHGTAAPEEIDLTDDAGSGASVEVPREDPVAESSDVGVPAGAV